MKIKFNLLLLFTILTANNTGSIEGRITNSITDDPIPFVAIYLDSYSDSTGIGNVTDLNGYFLIESIPPGKYSIQIVKLGYLRHFIDSVTIKADSTILLNESLIEAVIVGDVIFDQKRFKNQIKDELKNIELINLPIEKISDIFYNLPGTVIDDGIVHFRGSFADELAVYFDDVLLDNPLSSTPNGPNVPIFAVNEMHVLTGGFGVEKGDLQSMLIQLHPFYYSNRFRTHLRLSTSKYIFDSPEKYKQIEFSSSGPIKRNVAFYSLAGNFSADHGLLQNQYSNMKNIYGNISFKINRRLRIRFSGLLSQSDFQHGYDHEWSLTINEDRLAEFTLSYVRGFDGSNDQIRDGVINPEEMSEFLTADDQPFSYSDWWSTPGLQSEDADGDGSN